MYNCIGESLSLFLINIPVVSQWQVAVTMGWNQGLFNFCGDCRICLCGTFCVPCLICQNAHDLGKSGLVYNLLGKFFNHYNTSLPPLQLPFPSCAGCILPCLPTMLLRSAARERYGISGSDVSDGIVSWLCTPCVNCQTAVQLQSH